MADLHFENETVSERDYQISRPKHLRFSRRDTALNDLKNSTPEGIISFALSVISLLILVFAIYFSFRYNGNGDFRLGVLALISFLMSVMAVILSAVGFRNRKKIRHYMEKRAIVISLIVIIALVIIFINGLKIYLGTA